MTGPLMGASDPTEILTLTAEQKARLDRLQLRPSWHYWTKYAALDLQAV